MLTKFRIFFSAPVFPEDEDKTRRARLLHIILVAQTYLLFLMLGAMIASTFTSGGSLGFEFVMSMFGLSLIVLWRYLMRRGRVSLASGGMLFFFLLIISLILFSGGTIRSTGIVFFPATVVMAALLINRRAGAVAFLLTSIVGIILVQGEISGRLPAATNEISFSSIVTVVAGLGLILVLLSLATQGTDEALERAIAKEQEVREFASTLELRVAERTKALATSAEVSRRISTILDQQELIKQVVEEVRNAFNFYHAHIYLLDEITDDLIMAGGTGEAGATMVARAHKVQKGRGLVGRAAETKTPVLVPDTSSNPDWLPNPLLPDTRSELAVPMIVGGRVIGVFDVQSEVVGRFTEEDVNIQTTLASQVAVALQNARQFDQTQKAEGALRAVVEGTSTQVGEQFFQSLVKHLATTLNMQHAFIAQLDAANNRVRTRAFWKYNIPAENIEYSLTGTPCSNVIAGSLCVYPRKVQELFPQDLDLVALNAQSYIGIPLYKSTGEVLGHLAVLDTEPMRDEEFRKSVLQVFAARAGAELERQQAEETLFQRASQQETINTISHRIQAATTIEEAMQVAARELGHALGKRQTLVALEPSTLGGQGKEN
jgi:GAF domain-containing protein